MNEQEIASAVTDIATDLNLGSTDDETTDTTDTAGETSAATDTHGNDTAETRQPDETAPPAETAPPVRQAPKAWAKEQHERWGKLDKETQDYIELREKQMLEGLGQYSEKAKRADQWESAVKDYMPLIQQQGVTPHDAVRYLFEAHKNLSSGTPEQKMAYLARVAHSYGLDLSKAPAASAEEPAAVRELRERTERLERERQAELTERQREQGERIASEVQTFADAKDEKGNLKHPYFDECHEDIVAYIKAGHTLEKAYEKAVYANPVTRAKEFARLKTEEEAALRAKAKQEAEKARNASRTNVNSRDTRRQPTAPKGQKWEDTLDETFREIQERTH